MYFCEPQWATIFIQNKKTTNAIVFGVDGLKADEIPRPCLCIISIALSDSY